MPPISSTGKFAWMLSQKSPTGATRLYGKAGMHAERRNDTYKKELRPAKDRG